MVSLEVGGQMLDFMIDTGAQHSVVTKPIAPLSKDTIQIVGATGVPEYCPPATTTRLSLRGPRGHPPISLRPRMPGQAAGLRLTFKATSSDHLH